MSVHEVIGDADLGVLFGIGRDAVAIALLLVGLGGLGGIAVHLVLGRLAARRPASELPPPPVDPRIEVPAPRRHGERLQLPPPVVPAPAHSPEVDVDPGAEVNDPALTLIVAPEPTDPALTQLIKGRHDGDGMSGRR